MSAQWITEAADASVWTILDGTNATVREASALFPEKHVEVCLNQKYFVIKAALPCWKD